MGTATAQFTINGNFNISQAFQTIESEIKTEVENITKAALEDVKDYLEDVILTGDFDIDDFGFPPLHVDYDMDVPGIPECELRIQFDGMELYMQIDTIISGGATYTLNLLTSESDVGIGGKDFLVGVVLSIDLILSVEAEIDISSGFHIRLDDGVAIDIIMFSRNVSNIAL